MFQLTRLDESFAEITDVEELKIDELQATLLAIEALAAATMLYGFSQLSLVVLAISVIAQSVQLWGVPYMIFAYPGDRLMYAIITGVNLIAIILSFVTCVELQMNEVCAKQRRSLEHIECLRAKYS